METRPASPDSPRSVNKRPAWRSGRLALAAALAILLAGGVVWKVSAPIGSATITRDKGDDWAYSAQDGDSSVHLLPTANRQVPTVEYRYGDAGFRMTLLAGAEGAAKVTEDRLADGTVVLKGVFPGTEVEYRKIDNGLKEDIVLLRREAADAFPGAPTYGFALVLENAEPAVDQAGNMRPSFLNAGTGEYAFHLPQPFMTDAAGVSSEAIEVRMRHTLPTDAWYDDSVDPASQWLLVMSPSLDWLLDEARQFPVRVDPTVVHDR